MIEKSKREENTDYYYYCGLANYYGWGASENKGEAISFYLEGCVMGNAKCKYAQALFLEGDNKKELFKEVFQELLEQAKQGDSESQRMVSCYYLSDNRGIKKDTVEALKWLQKAAREKNAIALFNLAGCYIKGEYVDKNINLGKKYLIASADLGYEKAAIMLKKMGG